MKKQYVKQAFLWLFEVVIIAGIFTYLLGLLKPFEDCYDVITRFVAAVAIYQGIVLLINKNTLDAERDSILSLINIYEYALLYYECKEEHIKKILIEEIDKVNPQKVFFVDDHYNQLIDLKKYLENDTDEIKLVPLIKCSLIKLKRAYEVAGLAWNNILLLKYYK
jgi:hypothetical protein